MKYVSHSILRKLCTFYYKPRVQKNNSFLNFFCFFCAFCKILYKFTKKLKKRMENL